MTKGQVWIGAFLLLAAVVVGGLLLGLGGQARHEAASTADDIATLKSFLIEIPREPVKAEDFTAQPLRGAMPHLRDYLGRFILLNFWATWCEPCKAEMPEMEALYQELGDGNFVVLAVSTSEAVEKVEKFIAKTDYTFPVLADPDGTVSAQYSVKSIPLTYLIDPEGWIVGRALGPRKWNDPALRSYFAAKSTPDNPTGR